MPVGRRAGALARCGRYATRSQERGAAMMMAIPEIATMGPTSQAVGRTPSTSQSHPSGVAT